jgi:acyl-CoA hydrolase
MLEGKHPSQSRVEMTELILPSDANTHGTVFGGKVMQWIDIAAGVATSRHCRRTVVTVSVDSLHFHAPMKVGEVAVLEGKVHAAFGTSMECGVTVCAEDLHTGERRLCTSALLTFVALGDDGRPARVPPLLPETEEERQIFAAAQLRREERLARSQKA